MAQDIHHGSETLSSEMAQPRHALKVLGAGMVGHFVEFYDFAIYGLSVLIIAKHFFPRADPVAGVLAAFAVYGIAFVARPLGGIIFGAVGDRLGRKVMLATTLTAIGAATTAIGLLPTYDQIGIAAPLLLLICRLVQGFSAGGEAVGAPAFVLEHAPANRRAFWVCIVISMSAVPSIAAALLLSLISSSMSADAFNDWGWRISFYLAAPIAFIGLYIRNKTEESETFKKIQNEKKSENHSPLKEALTGNWTKLFQVFFIVALNAITFYFLVGYFVTYLQMTVSLSRTESLISNAAGVLVFAVMLPLAGRLSDRIGRKPMLIVGSLLIAVLCIPAFHLLASKTLVAAISAQLIISFALAIYGGGSYPFFMELFPTSIRLTGAAMSYNISYALFGGTGPFVGTFLVQKTGSPTAPAYYLCAVAVVALLVALKVPETKRESLDGAGGA